MIQETIRKGFLTDDNIFVLNIFIELLKLI